MAAYELWVIHTEEKERTGLDRFFRMFQFLFQLDDALCQECIMLSRLFVTGTGSLLCCFDAGLELDVSFPECLELSYESFGDIQAGHAGEDCQEP